MNQAIDTRPLADFVRDAAECIAQLKQTGQPLALTVDGRAELVVQDVKTYRRILAQVERWETFEAVKEGLESMKRGEGRPIDEFFDELEKMLKATDRP